MLPEYLLVDLKSSSNEKVKYKMNKKSPVILAVSFLLFSLIQTGYCPNLNISVKTNQRTYRFGDRVIISGNLTLDDLPCARGLVAIEIDDPKNNTYVIRTRPTGTNLNEEWAINITNMYPCDATGNPKKTFSPGSDVGLKMTIKNNAATSLNVTVFMSPHYSNGHPFQNASIFWGPQLMEPQQLITYWTSSALILPSSAVPGTATIYISVLTDLPRNGGFAYAPEKPITFNITTGGSSAPPPIFTDGTFNMSFKLHDTKAKVGNYTVYTRARTVDFPYYFTGKKTSFYVVLVTDLNKDKKVDIRDVTIVARAYGSDYTNATGTWDPRADITGPIYLVPDGKVDIRDVSLVANDFGKTGT
jgi:hypothetical protein